MYEIILKNWYQEKPDEIISESYKGMSFESLEAAAYYLGNNIDNMRNEFPIESISIEPKK